MRAAWQAGKFDHRQRRSPPRPDAWDSETEGQRLAELVGHHTPQEIAALLNREYHQLDGIQRTETAVVVQIRHRQVKGVGVGVWLGSRRGGPPMSDEFPSGHRLHANHLTPDALTVRPKPSAVTGWRAVAASSKVIAHYTERPEKLLRLLS